MITPGSFYVGSSDASLQVLNSLPVPGLMFPDHSFSTVRWSYLSGGAVLSSPL